MSTLLYRLGSIAYRSRGWFVAGWVVVLAVVGGALALNPPQMSTEFRIDGTPSQVVLDELADVMPDQAGTSASIVLVAPEGERVDTPDRAAAIAAAVATINADPNVLAPEEPSATDPTELTPEQQQAAAALAEAMTPAGDVPIAPLVVGESAISSVLVSADGSVAIMSVQLAENPMSLPDGATDAIVATASGLQDVGLDVLPSETLNQAIDVPLGPNELIGLAIAAIVLVITLGSLRLAGLPLGTALVGVGVGVGTAYALSAVIPMTSITPILALMIGLAVGIDYALFIVNRARRLVLDQGLSASEATARAVGTAGSAVFFAGLTVVVALSGLSIVGVEFLTTMALIAAGTVAIAVAVALTLLPALLGYAGERLVTPKERARAEAHDAESRVTFATRWAQGLVRHKAIVTTGVVVLLGLLAIPFGSMQLNLPSAATANLETTERQSFDATAGAFGVGFNAPLLVVAHGSAPLTPGAITELKSDLASLDNVAAVIPSGISADASAVTMTVIPETGPNDVATADLVHAIRAESFGDASSWADADVALGVTGVAAVNIDMSEVLSDALVPYLAIIVGASLLILLLVFRSVFVPVTATLGFVLTIMATLGATTAVFQWGWLHDLLGFDTPGPLLSFLPIIITGILYGLAMDYQMFLVSSMRESHVHGHPGVAGVVHGYRAAARVVVAAAVIMVSVFASFIFSHDAMIKQIGFALAFGILIDAFLVRMTLIPAVMAWAGERAWWLPRWLGRALPNLDVEGDTLVQRLAARDATDAPADPPALVGAGSRK